jgi:SAM-dependent methyltransferase
LKWIYETIEAQRDKRRTVNILDVGCGTGNVTLPLGLLPNSAVLGIDIHQGNLDIAASRNKFPNVKFRFQYLPECDIEDFDFIILTEVLEHIPDYMQVLEYIGKRGKRSMQFLLTIPNGWGPFEISQQPLYLMRKMGLDGFIWKVKRLLGKKEPYSQNYETPHVNFFRISKLKRELDSVGLKIAEVKNAYIFSPIIETYLPFVAIEKFSRLDNRLAQRLPSALVSGWYFRIIFKTSD